MTVSLALIHLTNFVLPAVLLGLVAAALAKLLWLRALGAVPLLRLAGWAAGAALAALIGGLLVTGRDGAMATYGAMVMACAAALAWRGWYRR